MNIFVLDEDPVVAAQMHCDKHCVKMVLELFQQLGSAMRRHGATDSHMPLTKSGKPLKGGYHNHPCTRWCGDSRDNFEWAAEHAMALAKEYTYRYGKKHACEAGIRYMARCSWIIPNVGKTPFAQAMPEEFKNNCAVTAYRDYYIIDKQKNIQCEWNKNRQSPDWWCVKDKNDSICL
tara:strand:+ start:332 stop:862 length:531 start_codon:yes stop_codon:yes gene_type:complete